MKHDFKGALDEINRIIPHLNGMGGSIRRAELGVICGERIETLIFALKLADFISCGTTYKMDDAGEEVINKAWAEGYRPDAEQIFLAMRDQLIKELEND